MLRYLLHVTVVIRSVYACMYITKKQPRKDIKDE